MGVRLMAYEVIKTAESGLISEELHLPIYELLVTTQRQHTDAMFIYKSIRVVYYMLSIPVNNYVSHSHIRRRHGIKGLNCHSNGRLQVNLAPRQPTC